MITQSELFSIFHYAPDTGIFTRVNPPRGYRSPKKGITTRGNNDYIQLKIEKKIYQAHRLAWLYVYGSFPDVPLDHIDGDRLNNRISNLRRATTKQNNENRKMQSNNTSGYRGVCWSKRQKAWKATVRHNGELLYLGYYKDINDAVMIVKNKREELFTHDYGRDMGMKHANG